MFLLQKVFIDKYPDIRENSCKFIMEIPQENNVYNTLFP